MPLIHSELTWQILEACMEVSNELGVGFVESVYHRALVIALRQKGLKVDPEVPLRVTFRGQSVGEFSADLLVENKVIVELKVVKALMPEHSAQVINYLKGTGYDVGLLVNFGVAKIEYKNLYRPGLK